MENGGKNNEYKYDLSSKSLDSGIIDTEDDSLELDNNSFRIKKKNHNKKQYENRGENVNNNQDKIKDNIEINFINNEKSTENHNYNKNNNVVVIENDDTQSINSINSSSIKSNNSSQKVYINSINSNDDDNQSYILNSDSDDQFDNDNCIIRKLGEHQHNSNNENENNPINNVQILKQEINGQVPEFDGIHQTATGVTDAATRLNINHLSIGGNTSDVTVGNKYIFDGNVVIKQFVIEKPTSNGTTTSNQNGNNNFEFERDKNSNSSIRRSASDQHNDNKNSTFLGIIAHKLKSQRSIVILSAIVIFLGAVLAIIGWSLDRKDTTSSFPSNTYYQIGDGDDSRKNIPIDSTIGSDIIAPGEVLRMVSRSEWIAQPPNSDLTNLTLPAHRVVIAHTATEPCDTQAQCVFRVRFIQTFHIESRGFDDIAYNFLVGGDGAVYEGRGWDKQGAHTKGYNVDSICISFIGTFNTIIPPKGQLNAAKLIIREGLQLKKLSNDFKLYGHRQLIATESPGAALFKELQKWSHFATELPSINPIKDFNPKSLNSTTNETEQKMKR